MSDSRLSRRAAEGDQRAFAAIFRRYHQDLYRYCVAILGDSQDAQDALQNTMVKVLAALPGEQREIRLKPWLYRIAHNEAIDLRRGQRPAEALDAEIPLIEAEPAQAIETQDRIRRLVADIGMLPERQRGALVMRELGDLSFEQIGAAFGTSAAVARQTVYEARLSLQRMSEGREMDCAAVTKALSDGDGRLLRRREMRAHLRSCPECCRFEDGLKDRQRDLAAIAPLPAVVATGLLQGLIGGAGAGGAAGGGALAGAGAATGKTVAGSVLAKGVATAAVVAVVGVSAADRSGLVNVGLPGDGSSGNGAGQAPAESPGASPPAASGQGGSVAPQDAAAAQHSQLQGAKALQLRAGAEGGPVQSTAGNAEAKGRSEAHQEAQHGNGPPAAVPNQGHGNSSNHGSEGAAAGSHSQAGAHSKGGAHSHAGVHGQGASGTQATGKNPPAQATPAKQPKSHGAKSASTGRAHSKGSSRGASAHHPSSTGTRKSHSHQASKPHHGRSEQAAASPAAEESTEQTAAP
jgi:RNA polymerase sigma factor (sigma-70 family)